MKRFSEQLFKKSQTVKLQSAEKRELRERLVSYMEYHPLPAELKETATIKKKAAVKSPLFTDAFTHVKIPFAYLLKSSAVAAALILIVVPFVAEKAVPGDSLYAVKVQFNEELRSTLTFDGYQKVEWETERLNRRIAEARLLASEGRLTEEVEAEVALAVRTHTENAQREIEELRTEDADGAAIASIALDTTLEVQSSSLRVDDETADSETEATPSTNLIANAIDESLSLSEAKSASSTPPAYDKLMARAEQNTTRIYELLGTIEQSAPGDQLVDVTRRIQDIERAILAAMELSATDELAARTQLVGVIQRTQKLIVYMTELEVTHTVDIETLVPVVLTEAEEDSVVSALSENLDNKVLRIKELYQIVEDEDVLEKADFALEELAEYAEKMASSSDNFAAYKLISEEADAMATDIIIALEQHLAPVESEIPEPSIETEPASTTDGAIENDTEEEVASTTEEVLETVEEETAEEEISTDEVIGESEETVEVDDNDETEQVPPSPVDTL